MLYLDSKMLNLLWKYKFAVGHVFIIVNGQILNKLPSHLVALLTAFSAEQSSFIISIINRPKYFLRFVTIYDGPCHVLLLIFVVCDTSGGCEPNLRSFCLGHFCTRQMPIWNWLLFKWLIYFLYMFDCLLILYCFLMILYHLLMILYGFSNDCVCLSYDFVWCSYDLVCCFYDYECYSYGFVLFSYDFAMFL